MLDQTHVFHTWISLAWSVSRVRRQFSQRKTLNYIVCGTNVGLLGTRNSRTCQWLLLLFTTVTTCNFIVNQCMDHQYMLIWWETYELWQIRICVAVKSMALNLDTGIFVSIFVWFLWDMNEYVLHIDLFIIIIQWHLFSTTDLEFYEPCSPFYGSWWISISRSLHSAKKVMNALCTCILRWTSPSSSMMCLNHIHAVQN